jgi:co-chaperonin GroES (HSP10)
MPVTGDFIVIGNGKVKEDGKVPPFVKKGDRILFPKYPGQTFKVEGIEYLVVRARNTSLGVNERPVPITGSGSSSNGSD